MPIITEMTIATTLRHGRYYRLCRALAAAVVVASMAATPTTAAEVTGRKPVTMRVASRSDAPLPTPQVAPHASSIADGRGTVFCNGIRLQDEIALVSTRNIRGCCEPEAIRRGICVERYGVCDEIGNRRWQPGDLDSFLAFDPTVPTVIFVHGNQISPWDAKYEWLNVYRRMILHGSDAPPIRFVIFSWPSSKLNTSTLNDVRIKAMRTGPAGCQLAWLIDQMPAETPLSLAGFSFGPRIITGSLHILAGGSLGGSMHLTERVHPDRQPISVIMMASALHAHWLGDGQYHGLAMTQVSRMFLVNNCADMAMKYYDYLEPGFGGPQALGFCGPTCISAENASKIMMRDVSRSVGSEHDLMRYVCAPGVAGLLWEYTAGSAIAETQTSN
jgi:hypothetical protein